TRRGRDELGARHRQRGRRCLGWRRLGRGRGRGTTACRWWRRDGRARRRCRDRPRQFVSTPEAELVVVLVFFSAAVAGDQAGPPGTKFALTQAESAVNR